MRPKTKIRSRGNVRSLSAQHRWAALYGHDEDGSPFARENLHYLRNFDLYNGTGQHYVYGAR